MNIVILSDMDLSGNMYNLARSINKFTDHEATNFVLRENLKYKFGSMVHVTDANKEEAKRTIYNADVVVYKEDPELIKKYGLDINMVKTKKSIILMGGWGFRLIKKRMLSFENYSEIRKRIYAVTSMDFLEEVPKWKYIPASINAEEMDGYRALIKKEDRVKIMTSPSTSSDKTLFITKNFDIVKEQTKDLDLDYSVVTGVSHKACLIAKASSDIYFDRIFSIYGMNSQEAAYLENVVVTGSSDYVQAATRQNGCPFIYVKNAFEAATEVRKLVEDKDKLRKLQKDGYEYVKRVHNGEMAVRKLMEALG